MKFICIAFLAAFAVAVETMDVGVKLEESNNLQQPSIRSKRTVGESEDIKREVEIKTKNGGSIKISKSIAYNDGGALTMLPAVMDSATNNRIRLLNQIQNGHGRPELANSMIAGASSGIDFTESSSGTSDFSVHTEVTSGQASSSATVDSAGLTQNVGSGIIHQSPTSSAASISEVSSGKAGESHVALSGGSTHVSVSGSPVVIGSPVIINGGSNVGSGVCCGSAPTVSGPAVSGSVVVSPVVSKPVVVSPVVSKPVVVSPIISKPVAVNPIIAGGVCCGQTQPTVPVNVIPVNIGHSHSHSLLQKHLEKTVEYHRRKQAHKQHLLNKLAAKHQPTSVVAIVPVQHVYTPQYVHQIPVGQYQSRHEGLKELLAYKHEMKAQKYRNKIAGEYAQHGSKCPSCCCN